MRGSVYLLRGRRPLVGTGLRGWCALPACLDKGEGVGRRCSDEGEGVSTKAFGQATPHRAVLLVQDEHAAGA